MEASENVWKQLEIARTWWKNPGPDSGRLRIMYKIDVPSKLPYDSK
jgi:hypothetical protein